MRVHLKCSAVLYLALAYEGLYKTNTVVELLKNHEGLYRQYQPEAVDVLLEVFHWNQKTIKTGQRELTMAGKCSLDWVAILQRVRERFGALS